MNKSLFLICLCVVGGCSQGNDDVLFRDRAHRSGIDFSNDLNFTEEFNPYTYRNFLNGAGVALGDINGDGLLDIYFTGNQVDNKLYLNKGGWKFEDITQKAGVACSGVWSSGATFIDINSDNLLDLYVCKSGLPGGKNRHNELFINNGDLTFTEKAKEYGLDVVGLSTHAAFFDYDKDGDLDCYILNNSIKSVGQGIDIIKGLREIPDPNNSGNKFFRNDSGRFTDVTSKAGIYTSAIGFGLGITLGDFNDDTWTDIFVSNDFFERDYLYINNTQGGFIESLDSLFGSTSMGSMGADAADLDNDGRPDLMVTEMLPEAYDRKKTKTMFDGWDKFNVKVDNGYHQQFSRNVLQRNLSSGFVELGRQSGVSDSDWSWGALLFDGNNDGLKDIFISNGIFKDLLDRDYLTYTANDESIRKMMKEGGEVILRLVDKMPSQAVPNAMYRNGGEFKFSQVREDWGFADESFSNGAAYGDLDNDGDLDLIVNNINQRAFVYQNKTDTAVNRSAQFTLKGTNNTFGVGAKIKLWVDGEELMVENYPSRGFQSSVDHRLHFGIGNYKTIDSAQVIWPSNKISRLKNLKTNSIHVVKEAEAKNAGRLDEVNSGDLIIKQTIVDHQHEENVFVDFNRDRLLTQMYSNEGPAIALADVNADGVDDFFLGGAKGHSGVLFLSTQNTYTKIQDFLADDINSEDIEAVFFDCDGDGDEDLYVASGGRYFPKSSDLLFDRLYINDKGNFTKSVTRLPASFVSTGTVSAGDFDGDGDVDIFVGERFDPFYYGLDGSGLILENDGQGNFKNVTIEVAPGLDKIGMITGSSWSDFNNDGQLDLILLGDWMGIRLFLNENKLLVEKTSDWNLDKTKGWWNTIEIGDINGDGKMDIVAGNHGANSFVNKNCRLFVRDFDSNGSIDHVLAEKIGDKFYPILDKEELISQMPELKKKLIYYSAYSQMSMEQIFGSELLESTKVLDLDILETSAWVNTGKGFEFIALPQEAQYTPVYAIEIADVNKDNYPDLILGGNQFAVKPQFGRYDAGKGLILFGSKDGFDAENLAHLGISGQIRGIRSFNTEKIKIIIGLNDDEARILELN